MAKSDKYRIKNKEKREKLLNYLLDEFGRVLASAESKTTNKTTAKSKSKSKSKSKTKSKKEKSKSTGKKKTTNKTTKSKSKSKKSKKRRKSPKKASSYAKRAARLKRNRGKVVVVVEHQTPTPETPRGRKLDEDHQAKPPGWRVSVSGNLYYEDRRNRSDLPGKKI